MSKQQRLHDPWRNVEAALTEAVSIAWDGCHKIYILMDEAQHDEMKGYGYDLLLRLDSLGAEAALAALREWYEQSCGLRFIDTVRTVKGNPNDGYEVLIGQFDDEDA